MTINLGHCFPLPVAESFCERDSIGSPYHASGPPATVGALNQREVRVDQARRNHAIVAFSADRDKPRSHYRDQTTDEYVVPERTATSPIGQPPTTSHTACTRAYTNATCSTT